MKPASVFPVAVFLVLSSNLASCDYSKGRSKSKNDGRKTPTVTEPSSTQPPKIQTTEIVSRSTLLEPRSTQPPEIQTTEIVSRSLSKKLEEVDVDLDNGSLTQRLIDIMIDATERKEERIRVFFADKWLAIRAQMNTTEKVELGLSLVRDVIVSTMQSTSGDAEDYPLGSGVFITQGPIDDLTWSISRGKKSRLGMDGLESSIDLEDSLGLSIHMMFKTEEDQSPFVTVMTSEHPPQRYKLSMTLTNTTGFLTCGFPRSKIFVTGTCSQSAKSCRCPLSPARGAPYFYTVRDTIWEEYINGYSDAFEFIQRVRIMKQRGLLPGLEQMKYFLGETFSRVLNTSDKVEKPVLVSFLFSEFLEPNIWDEKLSDELLEFVGSLVLPRGPAADLLNMVLRSSIMEVSITPNARSELSNSAVWTDEHTESETLLHLELNPIFFESLEKDFSRVVWVETATDAASRIVSFPLEIGQDLEIPVCVASEYLNQTKTLKVRTRYKDTNVICHVKGGKWIGVTLKRLGSLPEIFFGDDPIEAVMSLGVLYGKFGGSWSRFFETRLLSDLNAILRRNPNKSAVSLLYEQIISPAFDSAGDLESIAKILSCSFEFIPVDSSDEKVNIRILQGNSSLAISYTQTSLHFTTVTPLGDVASPILHAELKWKNLDDASYRGPLVLVNTHSPHGLKVSFRVEPSQPNRVYVCGNLDSNEFSTDQCHTLSFGDRIDCICEDRNLLGIEQVPFNEAINKIHGLPQLTEIGSMILNQDPDNFVEKYMSDIDVALRRLLKDEAGSGQDLDDLVANVLLPALEMSTDTFDQFSQVLELLCTIIAKKGPETHQSRTRGISFKATSLKRSQLESTSLIIAGEGSGKSSFTHLEIDTSSFPGIKEFHAGSLISNLVVIESEPQTNFDVSFEMKMANATQTTLPSCFSFDKGKPTAEKCDTYSFTQQIVCKCASANYIGVRQRDFQTVLNELKHVEQLTILLETIRERSGDKRVMYAEFPQILARLVKVIENKSITHEMDQARELINFARVTNEIFDGVLGNVKTAEEAFRGIRTLRGAYEVFMKLGITSGDIEFFGGDHVSIALNNRDEALHNGTSLRNTTIQFAGEETATRRFAHVVLEKSLFQDVFLSQNPDAERPLSGSVDVIVQNDVNQQAAVAPYKVEFFNVPNPAERSIKCGIVTEKSFDRGSCRTDLGLEDDDTTFGETLNVSCDCSGDGPYVVLATPIDTLMEETEKLADLLDFASLLHPRNELDLIWRNQRTLLEKLNQLLRDASSSEILEAFENMFELPMNKAEDILKMFAMLETLSASVRNRIEQGNEIDGRKRTFSFKKPTPKSEGLIADFPSTTVMDIDGLVNGAIWLHNEFDQNHTVLKKLTESVDRSEFEACSPLVNVYADFPRVNLKISTTCDAGPTRELRCARLDLHTRDTRTPFTMVGCRTNLMTQGFLHCDCAAPGPYVVFVTHRDKLIEMETNATAVVAVAEHFVRQHGGIGPIQDSKVDFLNRLKKISLYSSDSGANEAIRMISSRLLPEILFSATSETHDEMMNFARDSVLMLSKYLSAPVNKSDPPMALYVGKVSSTNLTVPLGSILISHHGASNDYTLFRELPRRYVRYLDGKLVSDVIDVWPRAGGKSKSTLDLTFEVNPRFRRTKHLPRCARFPPSGLHDCLTLEISNKIVCTCDGPGAFGVVLREHFEIAENFDGIGTMIRDSKWILSDSLDSLIDVRVNLVQGLRNWKKRVASRSYRRGELQSASVDSAFEALYGELLPLCLKKAKNVDDLSAVLGFFRHSSQALLENGGLLQRYLKRGSQLEGNIPAGELQRFGLNNGSVTLTTDLREVIDVTEAGRIVANFTAFRRIRHGDVKCVRLDTTNGYFDTAGCEIQDRTETVLTCVCDQPGAVAAIVVPFESNHALNIFSAIAITINIICLSVCMVFLYHVPDNHSLRCIFRFHQCAALMLGQAVLIVSTITVQSAPVFEPCNALVGFLLQFSFLGAAVFVGFEATEVLKETYLMSLSPATSGRNRFIFLGYGVPLLIATVSFGFNPVYVGSYQVCLVNHTQFLVWISAIPFMVVVGLCLIAAAAALLRLACLSEDRSERHATKLRSYSSSTILLAIIITLQWAPGHLIQIEGTGLMMSFLFFFATFIQGPIMLLLFVVYERNDRKAMARGLGRKEGELAKILANMVRPPVVGEKTGDAEPRTPSVREPSPSVGSESITRISAIELQKFSEAPVV